MPRYLSQSLEQRQRRAPLELILGGLAVGRQRGGRVAEGHQARLHVLPGLAGSLQT